MKSSLCILHWMPVECFPPAINMARYFADHDQWAVSVCTNWNHLDRRHFTHPSANLIRGTFPTDEIGFKWVLAYLSFHLKSLWHILKTSPDIILYIEPHSALPVFLSRLIGRRSCLFIHYHEYHSPNEFTKPGMRMAKWFHKLEKSWLYPSAEWISQTNEDRVRLFIEDNHEIEQSKLNVLPNYPPSYWFNGDNRAWKGMQPNSTVIRLVYVGSLSRVDAFIEEVVTWIMQLERPTVTLDIYSYNIHTETREYLREIGCAQIRLHEKGVDYDDLPNLLRDYHVGLILYKGNTPNYVYNATNKLFEYLACGLDVIYPRKMSGVKPYACSTLKPRVIECEFENMNNYSYQLHGREQLPSADLQPNNEVVMKKLEKVMLDSI